MKVRFLIVGLALAFAVAILFVPPRTTLLQRIADDQIALMPDSDPDLMQAIRKARETLPAFLSKARAAAPHREFFSVKVAISENGVKEYFWISPFRQDGEGFRGRINNTPRLVKKVKDGDEIAFHESQIVDWLYMEHGRMQGNFTLWALIRDEPAKEKAALKERYGHLCNF